MDASATEPDLSTTLSGENAPYVEDLYATYKRDPDSVGARWRAFFDALADSGGDRSASGPAAGNEKQAAVSRLLQSMGNRGHLVAKIDPLGLMQRPRPRVLTTVSNDSTHSRVSSGSMSGSWLGRPSLMIEKRWLPEATGGPRLPTAAGWAPASEIVMPRRVSAAGCVRSCPAQSSYPKPANASLPMGNLVVRPVARDSAGPGGPVRAASRGSNCDRGFRTVGEL